MRKMKYLNRKITILLFIVTSIFTSGCEDQFDTSSASGIKEENFNRTFQDLNASAFSIYAALSQEVHKFLLWGSARADLVLEGGENVYMSEFVNNRVSELNPYTNYAGLYKVIARCNQHLENIAKVDEMEPLLLQKNIEAYYGEVYYLRSLAYFYLVRTFKDFPLITDNLSEELSLEQEDGTIIKLKTVDLSGDDIRSIALKPASEQAVWEQIVSDANKAAALLKIDYVWSFAEFPTDDKGPTVIEKYGRTNISAGFALAADVYLWLGDFKKASSFAGLLINMSDYNVTSSSTWGNSCTAQTVALHSNSLLGYDFTKGRETNRLQEFTCHKTDFGGKYYLKPARNVLNELYYTSSDVRKAFTYKRIDGKDLIWRYIGTNNATGMRDPYKSDASWNLYRSGDTYLAYALANNRGGDKGSAFWALNEVRSNRGLGDILYEDFVLLTMEEIEDLILDERARELAFEGKRWYDLMLVSKVFGREDYLGEKVSMKYPESERESVKAYLSNQEMWYLPIDPIRWQ